MFLPREVGLRRAAWLLVTAGTALVFHTTDVRAQDLAWGNKMFELTEIKFGSAVAKGSDAVVQVRVKNVYQESIQVTSVSTGCSCVSWDETRKIPYPFPIVIPSGQTQVLNLRLDTIRFDGERKSKAMVSLFDPVHSAATVVELPVEAYIRRDIVVTPGAVIFGAVDLGSGAERKVEIQYAGRNDWKLMPPKVSSPYLSATLTETGRVSGRVNYELLVTLKPDSPVGNLRDQITMVTDDLNNPQVSLLVEAAIEPDIVVTDLEFGSISPGKPSVKNVIVRGKKPFKIESLEREEKSSGNLKDAFRVMNLDSKTSRTVHSLPITLRPPDHPGVFEEKFYIQIADRPQPVVFKARGRILEQPAGAPNN